MTRARLFLLVALMALWFTPSPAYASVGWWDWLEQLSGPGPFGKGFVLDHRFACLVKVDGQGKALDAAGESTTWVSSLTKDANALKCRANTKEVRGVFELRGGRITSEKQPLFSDAPGELIGIVAANTVQGYFLRHVDPSLAVGAGVGVLWFTGEKLDRHAARLSFTPVSVAFMPLKLFRRTGTKGGILVIRAEEIALVGGLQAKDFNSGSHSSFQTKSEVVRSVSITFDLLPLLK